MGAVYQRLVKTTKTVTFMVTVFILYIKCHKVFGDDHFALKRLPRLCGNVAVGKTPRWIMDEIQFSHFSFSSNFAGLFCRGQAVTTFVQMCWPPK